MAKQIVQKFKVGDRVWIPGVEEWREGVIVAPVRTLPWIIYYAIKLDTDGKVYHRSQGALRRSKPINEEGK